MHIFVHILCSNFRTHPRQSPTQSNNRAVRMMNNKITKAQLSRMVREALGIGKAGAISSDKQRTFEAAYAMAKEMLDEKYVLTVDRIRKRWATNKAAYDKKAGRSSSVSNKSGNKRANGFEKSASTDDSGSEGGVASQGTLKKARFEMSPAKTPKAAKTAPPSIE